MKRSIVSPGFVKRTLAKLLKLDQQLGIVVDRNVASQAIAVGNYVNLINSTITGKIDGIYVATGAVSSGGTVTASDISGNALAKGISNELSEQTVPKIVSGAGFAAGWSNTTCQVRKIGKLVYVNIYGDNISGSVQSGTIISGLPIPSVGSNQILTHYGQGGSGIVPVFGYVDNSGNFVLRNIAGNTIPNNDSLFGWLLYITT